jgi:hypothetical protein
MASDNTGQPNRNESKINLVEDSGQRDETDMGRT